MKRTYFHVKPLDQKQLRVWDQYLDWQGEQGDHQRIVVLFERCLIPCALYEQFWAKYARYLERAHKEGKDKDYMGRPDGELENGDIGKARDAFQTGLGCVDKIREARCSWTLRGWRETLKDGTEIMRAEEIVEEEETVVNQKEEETKEKENEDLVKSEDKHEVGQEDYTGDDVTVESSAALPLESCDPYEVGTV